MPVQRTSLNELPSDDWEARFTKQVIRNIVRYKDENGLTTTELAAAYSERAGDPDALKPTTLNNLLAGKRARISITEVILFAQALNVPPIALIFSTTNEPVQLSPTQGREIQAFEGYQWFLGEVGFSSSRDRAEYVSRPINFRMLATLYELRNKIYRENTDLIAFREAVEETGLSEQIDEPGWSLATDIELFATYRARLRERGVRLPELRGFLTLVDEEPLVLPSLPITSGFLPETRQLLRDRVAFFSAELQSAKAARMERDLFMESEEYLSWLKGREAEDESPA